ncbi:hypothetical protein AB0F77_10610 [Streptomyces sp. NPDC026672]|uniref:hypothetical protein n=1 Tax=unclassified Streptomyces TaxID=2593676 RepID=UPI0033CA2038
MASIITRSGDVSAARQLGEVRPDKEWFRWAGRHPVGALLVTAFVATQVATTVGYYMPAFGLPQLAWPLHNGFVAAPATPEGTAASYFVGQFMHYLNGIAFVLVFGLLVHPRLPFRDTELGNLLKAIVYVVGLTLIAAGLLVPKIYAPDAGYGLFSFGHGWKFPFAVLVWHLLFGVHIAALYNPGRVARIRLEDEQLLAGTNTEPMTRMGQ